jgi:uncharacterized membrane protein YfcA
MASLEMGTLAAVISAFLIAGIVKGALGMGLPTISIAIMGMALGLREAIPVLMIPSFLANLWQFTRPGPVMPLFKRFGALNAAACIGIWGGTVLLFRIDPAIINILFGGVVVIYASINLMHVDFTLPPGQEKLLGPPVGLFSGILSGVSGSLLLPVVVYLQALKLDKDTFIQATGLSLFIGTIVWAISLHSEGAMTEKAWILSAIAVPPILIGMTVGQWLRGRIPDTKFRTAVYLILIVLAANLVRKGFM